MSLDQALHILASVHTRDDDAIGFHVRMGVSEVGWQAGHECSQSDYIEAWKVVRDHIHMQTEPKST